MPSSLRLLCSRNRQIWKPSQNEMNESTRAYPPKVEGGSGKKNLPDDASLLTLFTVPEGWRWSRQEGNPEEWGSHSGLATLSVGKESEEPLVRIALYRALIEDCSEKGRLLFENKLEYIHDEDLTAAEKDYIMVKSMHPLQKAVRLKRWVVLLSHGGFAAGCCAVEGRITAHKSFKHYVVRRKQGGKQSTKDRSRRVKSAGAHLRRMGEEKMVLTWTKVLRSWQTFIDSADIIFCHLPGRNIDDLIFEGGPISRSDSRMRTIPLHTSRPSTAELRRIVAELSAIRILSDAEPFNGPPLTPQRDVSISASEEDGNGSSSEESDRDREPLEYNDDDCFF